MQFFLAKIREVWGFIDDSVMRLSASLAYATLFSIIPFLSLLVTVGVFFHMDLVNQLYVQLQPIVGPEVTEALRSIIENAENTDSSRSAAFVSLGISILCADIKNKKPSDQIDHLLLWYKPSIWYMTEKLETKEYQQSDADKK